MSPDAASAIARVDELDLAPIRFKLASQEFGKGWDEAFADLAIREYRRFLALKLIYPQQRFVPSKTVDEVWHTHILDTRKYAADCDSLFGGMLHHFPYLGTRGEQDAETLQRNFQGSLERYREAFQEAPPALLSPGAGNCDPGPGPDEPEPRPSSCNGPGECASCADGDPKAVAVGDHGWCNDV